jgi:hypothetical protein
MKKSLLVQMLVFFATTKEKYDLTYVDVLRHDILSYDEDVDLWLIIHLVRPTTRLSKVSWCLVKCISYHAERKSDII